MVAAESKSLNILGSASSPALNCEIAILWAAQKAGFGTDINRRL